MRQVCPLRWPASRRRPLCSLARRSVHPRLLAWVPRPCKMTPRQVHRRPTNRMPSLGVSSCPIRPRQLRLPPRQQVSRRRHRSWYPCQFRMLPCRPLLRRILLRPRSLLLRPPRQLRTRWTPSPHVHQFLKPLCRCVSRTMLGRSSMLVNSILQPCLPEPPLRLALRRLPSRPAKVASLPRVWTTRQSWADGFCAMY
jgi:hypothetical protein